MRLFGQTIGDVCRNLGPHAEGETKTGGVPDYIKVRVLLILTPVVLAIGLGLIIFGGKDMISIGSGLIGIVLGYWFR
jgi:hypothetical protein